MSIALRGIDLRTPCMAALAALAVVLSNPAQAVNGVG